MKEALIVDTRDAATSEPVPQTVEQLNGAQAQAVRNALWNVLSRHLPRSLFKRRQCSFCSMPAVKGCPRIRKCTAVSCAKHNCRCAAEITENVKAA